jgi:signal peptidase I
LKTSKKPQEKTQRTKSVFREYTESIVIAILLALLIRAFVIQAFKIPSGSMIPTLLVGDHILVNKFAYGIKFRVPFTAINKTLIPTASPKRFDVVVFIFPQDTSKDYIKRVIALPGETVEIRAKKIYINGRPLEDPYGTFYDPSIKTPEDREQGGRDYFGPEVVPKGHYFVMGDNRDFSYDSRFWKYVDERLILGKALIIYWSWDRENFGVRWSRLGKLVK